MRSRARAAGLKLVSPEALTIQRRRCGRGFVYVDEANGRISDDAVLERIRSLAIPPNYADVRIAKHPRAHLQAVGRDDAGRIQYRYHPDWENVREEQKIEHLAALCRALPRIRRRVERDLRLPEICRNRVLAGVVCLIDRTHIRIGCEDYVHSGRSRGATTLLKRNVRLTGDRIHLKFHGKGGREVDCETVSPALARLVTELRRLPGPRLFKYRNGNGALHNVNASELNEYLREVAHAPITAKDFRTLAATATAGLKLGAIEPDGRITHRRRQIAGVMREVSVLLSNTPAVVRKSYVHRRLVDAFSRGELRAVMVRAETDRYLSRGEALVAALFVDEAAPGKQRAA